MIPTEQTAFIYELPWWCLRLARIARHIIRILKLDQ